MSGGDGREAAQALARDVTEQNRQAPIDAVLVDGEVVAVYAIDRVREGLPVPPPRDIDEVLLRGEDPDEATYELRLRDDTIVVLGTARQLLDMQHVRSRMLHHAGLVRPEPKTAPDKWARTVEAIAAAAIPASGSHTEDEEMREWLAEWWQWVTGHVRGATPPRLVMDDSDALAGAMEGDGLWVGDDDRFYFVPAALRRWLRSHEGESVSTQRIRRLAGRLGLTAPNTSRGRLSAMRSSGQLVQRPVLVGPPGWRP